jgi:hypothetical protein
MSSAGFIFHNYSMKCELGKWDNGQMTIRGTNVPMVVYWYELSQYELAVIVRGRCTMPDSCDRKWSDCEWMTGESNDNDREM